MLKKPPKGGVAKYQTVEFLKTNLIQQFRCNNYYALVFTAVYSLHLPYLQDQMCRLLCGCTRRCKCSGYLLNLNTCTGAKNHPRLHIPEKRVCVSMQPWYQSPSTLVREVSLIEEYVTFKMYRHSLASPVLPEDLVLKPQSLLHTLNSPPITGVILV